MGRLFRVNDIKIKTILTASEAYSIAQNYHDKNNVAGEIPSNVFDAVYLDECHFLTKKATWMICSKLKPNSYEGMDRVTIMVLDESKSVFGVLDHNDIIIIKNK
jgi:hypothetical protein